MHKIVNIVTDYTCSEKEKLMRVCGKIERIFLSEKFARNTKRETCCIMDKKWSREHLG